MRLVLQPLRIVDPLVKADTRPHKYIKRERVYRKGKPSWRYYYRDEKDRTKHAKDLDPGSEDEHALIHEIGGYHENLKSKRPPTTAITTKYLAGLFGKKTSVRMSAAFQRNHVQSFVKAEAAGLPTERNPIQRVAQALEMLPKSVKQLINVKSFRVVSRTDPAIREKFEKGDPPRPVPASWSDSSGDILLCADGEGHGGKAGFNTEPHGGAGFGKALTLTEELVWHEIGKNLRQHIASNRKAMMDQWKALAGDPSTTKISATANQSWQIDFAESFAAMMSHPKQMAEQCPERYAFFQENGLTNAPPLSEMRTKAPEDFAWWEGVESTNARSLYLEMSGKIRESAPESVYVSDKDEYYTVTRNGRTVYLRMGPVGLYDEKDWRPLPNTTDPETGLPVYDSTVAQRFRAKGIVKEVYDEHGNRLDDAAAYFYLNQDEQMEKLPDTLGDYEALTEKQKNTQGLGYMMYIKMGESRGDQKAEAKEVKRLQGRVSREDTIVCVRGHARGREPALCGDRERQAPDRSSHEEAGAPRSRV
jgi:hypothetical protein